LIGSLESSTRRVAILAAVLLSGAAGLVCEVVWIRRASLVFGSTTFALSSVLAVFFLGLAAGSELFGRLTRRLARPLAAWAALELGLAALVLLSLPGFSLAEEAWARVYGASGGAGAATALARVALVALVILPPTLLMGGTLPLLCRHFVRERGRIAGSVGFLYGLNTLGAAAGCLLAGFVLIPTLGLSRSVALAAGLDLAAVLLVASARGARAAVGASAAAPPSPAPAAARATRATGAWVAALFLVGGFAAVGQEVVWTRFLSLVIDVDAYTYTLTLAAVLLGIVMGSLAVARLADRARARARRFAWLQLGFALSALALIALPPGAWQRFGGSPAVVFALLLPPALFSGASFPVAVRLVVDDPALAGAGVGRLAAIQTLGGILGSLAIGFVALPRFGLAAALALTTGASLLAGAAAWLLLERGTRLAPRAAAVAGCVALWAALVLPAGARLPAAFLAGGGELVDYREGVEAHVAVVRRDAALNLEIDRWWQGSDQKSHQIMAAHVPALLHPRPRRVLVVGVGVGQIAERFLLHGVDALDCVDIEPAVFDLIPLHFGGAWLADPRVRLIRADGRSWLAHASGTYDVVSLELGQISRPGVAGFYTTDFYERARERLAPGGLVAQFVPLPFLSPEPLRSVVRSFLEVFPASVLWYNRSELLLVGAADALAPDPERLAGAGLDARIREDLRYSQWGGREHWLDQPHAFLGGLLVGRRGLERFAAGAALLRDDHPWLEYAAGGSSFEQSSRNELDFAAAIRPHLEPVAAALGVEVDASTAKAAERMRQLNLGDIVAGAELRRVRALRQRLPLRQLLPIAERALAANPESAEAHLVAGQVLARLGGSRRAAGELGRAIELRPDDPRAHRELALLLHQQRRLAEAIPHYRAALGAREDAKTHFNLAAALLESGAPGDARRHLEAALGLDPGLAEARRQLERLRSAN
jgi:spermidine synthase